MQDESLLLMLLLHQSKLQLFYFRHLFYNYNQLLMPMEAAYTKEMKLCKYSFIYFHNEQAFAFLYHHHLHCHNIDSWTDQVWILSTSMFLMKNHNIRMVDKDCKEDKTYYQLLCTVQRWDPLDPRQLHSQYVYLLPRSWSCRRKFSLDVEIHTGFYPWCWVGSCICTFW